MTPDHVFTLNDLKGNALYCPNWIMPHSQPLTAQLPLEMVRDQNLMREDALTVKFKIASCDRQCRWGRIKSSGRCQIVYKYTFADCKYPTALLKLIFAFTTRLSVMVSALVEFWVKVKLHPVAVWMSEYAQIIPGCNKSGVVGHTHSKQSFCKMEPGWPLRFVRRQ